jgi:hypothetical protein
MIYFIPKNYYLQYKTNENLKALVEIYFEITDKDKSYKE